MSSCSSCKFWSQSGKETGACRRYPPSVGVTVARGDFRVPITTSASHWCGEYQGREDTTREICKACYHPNPVGFTVPDNVWQSAVPANLRDGVLCITCFARLADEALIEWDRDIQFWPVSRYGAIHTPSEDLQT